jgi:hypothetical protein
MSQMSQFKFKSGIEIVLPVPRRGASAFRGPAPKERKNAAHGLMRGRRPCAEKIKWNKILPDAWDVFFRPSGASVIFWAPHPRLAPWAVFFRRFAAAARRSLLTAARPTLMRGRLSCEANSHVRPTLMRDQPHARPTLIVAGHRILAILPARRLRLSSAGVARKAVTDVHADPIVGLAAGTRLVNSCNFQIHACNFSHSSAINNPPRAEVWQPVVVCLNLSCPPGI